MSNNQQMILDIMDNAARIGAERRERREQRKFDENQRIEYARALELAKNTGEFPDHFQITYPSDYYGTQRIIRTVLLRELEKLDPNHPMLIEACRGSVASVGLILYNRDDRPADADYANYAPDEETLQRIFAAHIAQREK